LAVAVSACFPPIFRPIKITLRNKEAEEFKRTPSFLNDWDYYQQYEASHDLKETPVDAELLDGGVSDNKGTNFIVDWIAGAKLHGDAPPRIKFTLAYDAGQTQPLDLTFWERRSRVKLALAIQSRIYSGREHLNDTVVRRVTSEHGSRYALHRAIPNLDSDIGLSPNVLDALMKLRTDLDVFSDTEIFALAYSGYRLAEFGFHELNLKSGALRSAEECLAEFTELTKGILSPLPKHKWERHLRYGVSRVKMYRGLKRAVRRS
jgi:hypothetical protein